MKKRTVFNLIVFALIATAALVAANIINYAFAATSTASLWSNATTPTYTTTTDPRAVELGVKFKPNQNGYISGIKFYKGAGNGGIHVGSLWNSTGTLLASAKFVSETSSGWQQVNFVKPIAVSGGKLYTASYFAPKGHYAYNDSYFKNPRVSGPLTAPASSAVSGNGVYNYDKSAFPTNTYNSGNYWVDVLFTSQSATPIPPTQTLTNGSYINLNNTGYLAWRGPSGETCTDSTMKVYNSRVSASSLGAKATCVWFKEGIDIDANIILNACRVDVPVSTYPQLKHVDLNYCTINATTPGDWSLGPANFTAVRSQIMGSSDGVRYGGSTTDTLIENYIRTKTQSTDDHNDAIQAYGAEGGGFILRNNVNGNPVGGGSGNAAVLIADGATGIFDIRDNYFSGGGYTLRLHESAYYRLVGNIIEKGSYLYDPLTTNNAINGAFLEWSNNRLSDNTVITP